MIPRLPAQLQAFAPEYAEPVNTRSQVDRLPGVDAPCLCVKAGVCLRCGSDVLSSGVHLRADLAPCFGSSQCGYPFCPWHEHDKEDGE